MEVQEPLERGVVAVVGPVTPEYKTVCLLCGCGSACSRNNQCLARMHSTRSSQHHHHTSLQWECHAGIHVRRTWSFEEMHYIPHHTCDLSIHNVCYIELHTIDTPIGVSEKRGG